MEILILAMESATVSKGVSGEGFKTMIRSASSKRTLSKVTSGWTVMNFSSAGAINRDYISSDAETRITED